MSANKDHKASWYSVACAGLAIVVCITAICGGGAFFARTLFRRFLRRRFVPPKVL